MNTRMRQVRIERGWTQEYVAKHVGITHVSVYQIETGKSKPTYDVLCKLEQLFGMSHRELFGEAKTGSDVL